MRDHATAQMQGRSKPSGTSLEQFDKLSRHGYAGKDNGAPESPTEVVADASLDKIDAALGLSRYSLSLIAAYWQLIGVQR